MPLEIVGLGPVGIAIGVAQQLFNRGDGAPVTTDYGVPYSGEFATGAFESGGYGAPLQDYATGGFEPPPVPVDYPAQQVQPPGATFEWPKPGGGTVPGTSVTIPGQPTVPGGAPPPAFPPLEGMGERLPPDAEFSLPAEPPPWWLRMGVGLGGLLWPSEIGEEWPAGTPNPATPGPDPVWQQQQRPDLFPGTIVDSATPDWWEREAMKELDRQAAERSANEEAFRRGTEAAIQRATAPAPAPAPVPSLRTRLWPWIGLGLGVAGLAGRSRSSQTLPTGSFSLPVDPITAGNTAATTYTSTQTSGAGAWGGGWGSQTCEPAKRGPRRKCLQRAPVKFSAGPRKGKAAGSKCLRFSTRKSA